MDDRIILPPVVTAGTDATADLYLHNPHSFGVMVTDIDIMPSTSVSTHASNYITTTVSAGGVTLATHTTDSSGGSALTAGTPLQMTFAATGVGTALEVAAGGTVRVQVAKAGTGPAYNNQIVVTAKPRRGGV